jgi:predicted protein tyrosine phosphatase
MEFIVVSREEIESGVLARNPYIVISITDPGSNPAKIPRTAGLRDILRLEFHDAEPVDGFSLPPEVVLMNKNQADQIWRFVNQWKASIGTIIVHCEQGMSRSPAVAAAIARQANGEDRKFFQEHMPNIYIYNLLVWMPQS